MSLSSCTKPIYCMQTPRFSGKDMGIWNYNKDTQKADRTIPLFNMNLTRDSKTGTSTTHFYGMVLKEIFRHWCLTASASHGLGADSPLTVKIHRRKFECVSAAWIALDCENCFIAMTGAPRRGSG